MVNQDKELEEYVQVRSKSIVDELDLKPIGIERDKALHIVQYLIRKPYHQLNNGILDFRLLKFSSMDGEDFFRAFEIKGPADLAVIKEFFKVLSTGRINYIWLCSFQYRDRGDGTCIVIVVLPTLVGEVESEPYVKEDLV